MTFKAITTSSMRLFSVTACLPFIFFTSCDTAPAPDSSPGDQVPSPYALTVKEATQRSWQAYLDHAWPHDNLLPVSGGFHDWYEEPIYISPIDAYSTLKVMGLEAEANRVHRFVVDSLSFDKDLRVKVFEVNIRILGGLLAIYEWTEDEEVLARARDFGDRLLPAFTTPTGLPYYYVNLKTGATEGEVINVAEGGTYLFEFGLLSYYTKNPRYYQAAKKATLALFERRSELDLLGRDINVRTGEWTVPHSMIGCYVDSFYEYLYKSWLLFGDPELLNVWNTVYPATQDHIAEADGNRVWYGRYDMQNGQRVSSEVTLWDAYFPALLTLSGHLEEARSAQEAWDFLWRKHDIIPQAYDYAADTVVNPYYQLNPEVIESNYHLWHYTGDSTYYYRAVTYWENLLEHCRTDIAFTHLRDVRTKETDDMMATFWIAETLKYFYLTFSEKPFVNPEDFVFNTEAHPFAKRNFDHGEARDRLGY